MALPNEPIFQGLNDLEHVVRVFARLTAAMVVGAILGYEREHVGKAAGLRTHILVALGSALFVLVPLEAGVDVGPVGRVMQGVITGIGFLGAGAILKQENQLRVRGLTTAATIWVTAALGMAVGLGWLWPAVLVAALAWLTLAVLGWIEHWLEGRGIER